MFHSCLCFLPITVLLIFYLTWSYDIHIHQGFINSWGLSACYVNNLFMFLMNTVSAKFLFCYLAWNYINNLLHTLHLFSFWLVRTHETVIQRRKWQNTNFYHSLLLQIYQNMLLWQVVQLNKWNWIWTHDLRLIVSVWSESLEPIHPLEHEGKAVHNSHLRHDTRHESRETYFVFQIQIRPSSKLIFTIALIMFQIEHVWCPVVSCFLNKWNSMTRKFISHTVNILVKEKMWNISCQQTFLLCFFFFLGRREPGGLKTVLQRKGKWCSLVHLDCIYPVCRKKL